MEGEFKRKFSKPLGWQAFEEEVHMIFQENPIVKREEKIEELYKRLHLFTLHVGSSMMA